MNESVLVMLASYNGSEYIAEQVDSILDQENVEAQVLIRDDGSRDETVKLIQSRYSQSERVDLIDASENLGCAQSFMDMVNNVELNSDYYAFSDQDDYWKPNRLERAIKAIQEKATNSDHAVLYCCNREEVDAERAFLYYNVPIENNDRYKTLEYLLFVRNVAPGNTMVFNRSFLELLKGEGRVDFPAGFYHDFWVHLFAVSRQDVEVVYDLGYSGVERRITGKNVAGFNRNKGRTLKSLLNQFNKYQPRSLQLITSDLLSRCGDAIGDKEKELLSLFANARLFSTKVRLLSLSKRVKFDSSKGRLFNLYKLLSGKI